MRRQAAIGSRSRESAVAGPLKGGQLTLVPQDELSFGLWRKEQPNGTVLAPLPRYAANYEKADWENRIGKLPTVIHGTKGSLADRDTIIGVASGAAAEAYPLTKLTAQSPVLLDVVGDEPIMLVLGPDGKSVRVFSRQVGGQALEFYGHSAANANDPGRSLTTRPSAGGASTVAPFRAI